MSIHSVDHAELTASDLARIEENGRLAGHALDELVIEHILHRAAGCDVWYCADGETVDRIAAYEHHQLAQMLAIAVHRMSERGNG